MTIITAPKSCLVPESVFFSNGNETVAAHPSWSDLSLVVSSLILCRVAVGEEDVTLGEWTGLGDAASAYRRKDILPS